MKMKIKLPSLLITLALITGILAACYPVTGDSEYRTLPLGTGTLAPVVLETEPEVTSEITEETTAPAPETTEITSDETTVEAIVTTEAETAEETTSAPEIVTYQYDVIEDTREIGEISGQKYYAVIRYPAITTLEDAAKQEKLNNTIMQHAVIQYQNLLPNASELISSKTAVSYEITSTEVTYMGNGIVSARSEGVIDYSDDTSDLKFAYSITLDLSTGRDISLKKIYSDFGEIMKLFTSGKMYYACSVRLVLFPVLSVALMLLLQLLPALAITDNMILGVFISFAMPTAGLASAFSDQYHGDTENAVILTLGTTIVSAAAIPLLYWLVQSVLTAF